MNYQRIYDQIIDRAKTRQIEGYYETHHIIPKCIGGLNRKSNTVKLTAKEHFICHRLLCEIYPEHIGLKSALWFLINAARVYQKRYNPSGKIYENIKKEYSIAQSKNMIGKKQSKETRQKKSQTLTGMRKSKEHSLNISKAKTGRGNHMFGVTGYNNKRSKPVTQYDLQMNFVQEWPNGKIASEQLKISYVGINNCCLNRIKSSGGFIWEFKK